MLRKAIVARNHLITFGTQSSGRQSVLEPHGHASVCGCRRRNGSPVEMTSLMGQPANRLRGPDGCRGLSTRLGQPRRRSRVALPRRLPTGGSLSVPDPLITHSQAMPHTRAPHAARLRDKTLRAPSANAGISAVRLPRRQCRLGKCARLHIGRARARRPDPTRTDGRADSREDTGWAAPPRICKQVTPARTG